MLLDANGMRGVSGILPLCDAPDVSERDSQKVFSGLWSASNAKPL
jgi:hypothetical protein